MLPNLIILVMQLSWFYYTVYRKFLFLKITPGFKNVWNLDTWNKRLRITLDIKSPNVSFQELEWTGKLGILRNIKLIQAKYTCIKW